MKARRRKKIDPRVMARALAEEAGDVDPDATVAPRRRVSIDRRSVESTLLVQLDELEHIEEAGEADVEAAIVKVCPRIPASNRDRFDAAATARRIRELGARSVVVVPIIVPDAAEKPRALAPKMRPREMVDAWLEEQHVEDDERDDIRELVFGFMDSEGL